MFAEAGAKVAVHGRDAAAADAVRAGIERTGACADVFLADVTRFEAIETMRLKIEERLGPIEILVTNAGGNEFLPPGPVEAIVGAASQATVDANLTATFLTVKSVLPGMKSRRSGSIITLSSSAARRPTARSPAPYTAAKGGIELLSQILAAQAGSFGIRVNSIAPETILTERNAQRIPKAQQEALAHSHPLERLGTPPDVAGAALFLASEHSSWITGVVLDVAGGA
ncbi:MAG: SDR family NAD(P)-dependent oxidoreductase, partial [Steroidobacteraceae bacterium]